MNEKDAINVLTQAVLIGQKAGIYSFKDSTLIYQALTILNPEFNKDNQQEVDTKKEESAE